MMEHYENNFKEVDDLIDCLLVQQIAEESLMDKNTFKQNREKHLSSYEFYINSKSMKESWDRKYFFLLNHRLLVPKYALQQRKKLPESYYDSIMLHFCNNIKNISQSEIKHNWNISYCKNYVMSYELKILALKNKLRYL